MAVLVVMLLLGAVSLVLALLGREGAWMMAGSSLAVAVGALVQLRVFTPVGASEPLTTRTRLLLIGFAVVAAGCLVVAGVTSGSAFTWVIVGIFLVGLASMTVGLLRNLTSAARGPA